MTDEISGDELDRIGAIGENRFEHLCQLARLKCSKVHPDKTGKDFVVEFSLGATQGIQSLDKRPPPHKILFQVKTILARNDRATLWLSVAERLAKDLCPTVVAIFRIDEDDEIVDLHFVHLVDDQLGRILKSLRRASLLVDAKLNKMSISFKAMPADRVPMARTDFYAAVASLSGGNMLTYGERKTRLLAELGFASERRRMSFALAASPDDIIDGFLAKKPLKIQDVSFSEVRFDIELPVETFANATLEFGRTTYASGTCVIRSKDPTVIPDASIAAHYTIVPELIAGLGNYAISIQTEYGEFVIKASSWAFTASPNYFPSHNHTVDEWIGFLELSILIASGVFSMNLYRDGSSIPLIFNVSALDPDARILVEKRHVRLLAAIRELLATVGIEGVRFTLDEAAKSRKAADLILKTGKSPTATFTSVSYDPSIPSFDEEPGALVSAVRLFDNWIGFVMPISVTTARGPDGTKFTGKQTRKAIVERLPSGDTDEAFSKFRDKYLELLNIQVAFAQKPGEFMEGETGLLDLRGSATLSGV